MEHIWKKKHRQWKEQQEHERPPAAEQKGEHIV